jgi:hypothetical protein
MNKIMLLPNLKRKVGKKLKISDNLAAHISLAVDQPLPRKDQVSCLQRSELQTLDVGVFGLLKTAWRKILTDSTAKNPNLVGIQKSDFPSLLDALLRKVQREKPLPAVLAACGLYPLNIDRPMNRIPSSQCCEFGSV